MGASHSLSVSYSNTGMLLIYIHLCIVLYGQTSVIYIKRGVMCYILTFMNSRSKQFHRLLTYMAKS